MRLVQRVCRHANWRIHTCARATISMPPSIHPLAMTIWARDAWLVKMHRRVRNRPGLRNPAAAATDGNLNPTCVTKRALAYCGGGPSWHACGGGGEPQWPRSGTSHLEQAPSATAAPRSIASRVMRPVRTIKAEDLAPEFGIALRITNPIPLRIILHMPANP
jgi:hypothetical protein